MKLALSLLLAALLVGAGAEPHPHAAGRRLLDKPSKDVFKCLNYVKFDSFEACIAAGGNEACTEKCDAHPSGRFDGGFCLGHYRGDDAHGPSIAQCCCFLA